VTPLDAVHEVARDLGEAGVPSPRVDAEHLVAYVLGQTRSGLYASDEALSVGELGRLQPLVEGRRAREPLAYVLGEWGFRRLLLAVDRRALIPRPETEVVVERCLAYLEQLPEPRVLDVGTGSGAIALALKAERPDLRVVATDASAEALDVARANAARLGLEVELHHGDLLAGVRGPLDAVACNPPYVEDGAVLAPEIVGYEPALALRAGPDGLDVIRRLLPAVGATTAHTVALEIGAGQAGAVAGLIRGAGFPQVETVADLAGHERVLVGRRR
jgi:release factor glutamine methyltransferase